MREGWKCPVCGKGVSPDKDTCEHGGLGPLTNFNPFHDHGTPVPQPNWPTTTGDSDLPIRQDGVICNA